MMNSLVRDQQVAIAGIHEGPFLSHKIEVVAAPIYLI